jgi:hypothetical protein
VLILAKAALAAEVGLRRLRLVEVTHQDQTTQSSSQQQRAVREQWPFEDASFQLLLKGSFSFSMTTPTSVKSPAPSSLSNGNSSPTASPTSKAVSMTTTAPTTATVSQSMTSSPTMVSSSDRSQLIQSKCGTSEYERTSNLTSILFVPSNSTGTPQYQAFTWLDLYDGAILCPTSGQEDRVLQRYRVALVYFALNGDQWINCNFNTSFCLNLDNATETPNPWLSPSNECSWFGITCPDPQPTTADEFQALDGLNLNNNNLSGTWPTELFGLTELTGLALNGNEIEGTLPSELGQLTTLQYFDMEANQLGGTLPSELYTLTSLVALGLGHNQFDGTLASEIGVLSDLSILFLESNNFSGLLPTDALFQLTELGKLLSKGA